MCSFQHDSVLDMALAVATAQGNPNGLSRGSKPCSTFYAHRLSAGGAVGVTSPPASQDQGLPCRGVSFRVVCACGAAVLSARVSGPVGTSAARRW
jgi:hypothetical protein